MMSPKQKTATENKPFVGGTGWLGGTDPTQKVTPENFHLLPAGSVVFVSTALGNYSFHDLLIRLHDNTWFMGSGTSWCYAREYDMKERLLSFQRTMIKFSMELSHVPPSKQ